MLRRGFYDCNSFRIWKISVSLIQKFNPDYLTSILINLGRKIIIPITTAIMAEIVTAKAPKSLALPIKGSFSRVIRSARTSTAVFKASAPNTIPIANVTRHHSTGDIEKIIPTIITRKATTQCIRALCSYTTRELSPCQAYLKALPLFFQENFVFSIIIKNYREDSIIVV